MHKWKSVFFINLLALLGLFFAFGYANGQTQSKLFSKNSQVPAAKIPESDVSQILVLATIHLKRALGQLTGNSNGAELITADGSVVRPFLTPESINTVVFDDKKFLLPSPIVPLNWAKAALSMALNRYEQEVFGDVEFIQQNIGK